MNNRAGRRSAADGFTLIELMLVVAVIGVVASIAVPGYQTARMAANEASAIGSSRSIIESQEVYAATCGRSFYAGDIEELTEGGFASATMTSGFRSGFEFSLSPSFDGFAGPRDCYGNGTVSAYYFSAAPRTPSTGRRAFAASQDGTIWVDDTGVAPSEPLGSGAELPLETVEITP